MFDTLYARVMERCKKCALEDATFLLHLAKMYRRALDISSLPDLNMSYEDRCSRTAKLENTIADIQDMMRVTPSTNRRMIAGMYEKVVVAIKKYKSFNKDTASWNHAFVEALKASIEIAEFEGDVIRADKYRKVIPFYESLRCLAEIQSSLDVNSAEWHDIMLRIYEEKKNISLEGSLEHIDEIEHLAMLHRDASIAIRLNTLLPVGSLVWFSNAEKLHHIINRLGSDLNSISSRLK